MSECKGLLLFPLLSLLRSSIGVNSLFSRCQNARGYCSSLSLVSLLRSILDRVGKQDRTQIRLVFDAIDKDRDGTISLPELETFAADLGWVWSVGWAWLQARMIV